MLGPFYDAIELGNPASGDDPPASSGTSVSDTWRRGEMPRKRRTEHLPRRYNECPAGSGQCCGTGKRSLDSGGTTRCVADTADEPMGRRRRAAPTGGLTLPRNTKDQTLLPAHRQGKCRC
ncbi:hypothetical protein Q5P01_002046 [Channa striata]|uniref:Uncharacterized protein n=1 Tax=Channa striata TaxID=64152 RepID=A0AA88NSI5_CHASR|nr:hypothetical protein Q5P01_002046 [Channa striata]